MANAVLVLNLLKDGKQAIAEDELPDGTHVPAGAVVLYLIEAMGRSEALWADASTYNPARGLSGESEPSSFKFIAFNAGVMHSNICGDLNMAGPRLCLGQNLAYLEAETFLAMFLQQFTFKASPGAILHF